MNRNRSRSRGVTPFAAALAVMALGTSVTGLWWFQSASARTDGEASSRTAAAEVHAAATSFRAQHDDGCPTVSSLKEEHLLNRGASGDDAWGNRFRVRCEAHELAVTSAGPDGKANTADDIRVPR